MNPSFFQLPIHFSIEKLKQELQFCETENWPAHFNTQHYSGSWNSIALRSGTGAMHDIHSFPNQTYLNTPLLDSCRYFQEVIDWFQCEKEAIRLLRLDPFSEIKEHTDNDTSYADGFFRIHIPVVTNEGVQFYVNKQLVPMKEGECWYADFQLPHRVLNTSDRPRVHLVIDCIRNAWSDTIFGEAGFDLTQSVKTENMPDTVTQQIIAELLRNPTEDNIKLAASLHIQK
jgi:aspartyl/asparaginyl beta-hydroxylase (cupin superfamily)